LVGLTAVNLKLSVGIVNKTTIIRLWVTIRCTVFNLTRFEAFEMLEFDLLIEKLVDKMSSQSNFIISQPTHTAGATSYLKDETRELRVAVAVFRTEADVPDVLNPDPTAEVLPDW